MATVGVEGLRYWQWLWVTNLPWWGHSAVQWRHYWSAVDVESVLVSVSISGPLHPPLTGRPSPPPTVACLSSRRRRRGRDVVCWLAETGCVRRQCEMHRRPTRWAHEPIVTDNQPLANRTIRVLPHAGVLLLLLLLPLLLLELSNEHINLVC